MVVEFSEYIIGCLCLDGGRHLLTPLLHVRNIPDLFVHAKVVRSLIEPLVVGYFVFAVDKSPKRRTPI